MASASGQPRRVQLTKVQETLLIPLYAKALDFRSEASILHDEQANRIVALVDYDFEKVRQGFGRDLLVARARQFDEWVRDFIRREPTCVVLQAGCGLDARIARVDPPSSVRWFDLDYPEVIQLRQEFYPAREGYQMMGVSLADAAWLERVPNDRPGILIADGVLEYLTREQVGTLLNGLTDHFPHGEAAFDIMSASAIKSAQSEIRDESGPIHKWAVEEAKEVDELDHKMKRIAEMSLMQSPYIRELPLRSRLIYGSMALIPRFRKLLRLLRYRF